MNSCHKVTTFLFNYAILILGEVMKKLLFLLLLFIPCFIFSEETFEPYVGEVNNKNGAYLYYYDDEIDNYVASPNSLEYKTKVYVYDEEDKFVVTENFTDYLLKSDIDKTNSP